MQMRTALHDVVGFDSLIDILSEVRTRSGRPESKDRYRRQAPSNVSG